MKVGLVVILVLITCNISHSQARQGQSGSSAQSSLTLTATVESSVWLIMEPNGKREVIVANAPDSKESFSHVTVNKTGRESAAGKKQTSTVRSRELPRQDDAAVQFSFPTGSKRFDVTKTTVMTQISEGGKTEPRPVMVTTVVPR